MAFLLHFLFMPITTYLEAIRQGIWEEMERDPTVFCLGEDIGIYGGTFKVTDGFIERLGPGRVGFPASIPLNGDRDRDPYPVHGLCSAV
jgi:hypothetical protein